MKDMLISVFCSIMLDWDMGMVIADCYQKFIFGCLIQGYITQINIDIGVWLEISSLFWLE